MRNRENLFSDKLSGPVLLITMRELAEGCELITMNDLGEGWGIWSSSFKKRFLLDAFGAVKVTFQAGTHEVQSVATCA